MSKEKAIPLGEVCNVEYGTRVVKKRDGGSVYPVFGGGGATFRMDEFNREDRVVIARFGMSEVCTRFVPGKFFLNDSGLTVSPKNGALVQRFLDYQILFLNDKIYNLGKGTAQRNLDVPVFRTLALFSPNGVPEQQRIVATLDEAFESIAAAKANAEKNLQNARALLESHLQSVFSQRHHGWIEKTLEDICLKITDGEHIRPKVTSEGVPFLSAKDVQAHDVVFTDPLFVSEADALKFRKRCNPEMGDILIVSRGATVGRTCIVKTNRIFCLLGSVILLKINRTESSQFISYALKSPAIRNQLMTASEASAQQAIYLRDVRPLRIGCPPLAEQQAIVSRFDVFNSETQRLESIYQQKLVVLELLKKSLLHQAFTGKL